MNKEVSGNVLKNEVLWNEGQESDAARGYGVGGWLTPRKEGQPK